MATKKSRRVGMEVVRQMYIDNPIITLVELAEITGWALGTLNKYSSMEKWSLLKKSVSSGEGLQARRVGLITQKIDSLDFYSKRKEFIRKWFENYEDLYKEEPQKLNSMAYADMQKAFLIAEDRLSLLIGLEEEEEGKSKSDGLLDEVANLE